LTTVIKLATLYIRWRQNKTSSRRCWSITSGHRRNVECGDKHLLSHAMF